jgi:hypothetical protein
MRDIRRVPGDEVIDPDDPEALGQETIRQMTAEKASPARDNCYFHGLITARRGWE